MKDVNPEVEVTDFAVPYPSEMMDEKIQLPDPEHESPTYKLLIKTVDPNRLKKELTSKLDEIKTKVKDSQVIRYDDFESIIELSRLLNKVAIDRSKQVSE